MILKRPKLDLCSKHQATEGLFVCLIHYAPFFYSTFETNKFFSDEMEIKGIDFFYWELVLLSDPPGRDHVRQSGITLFSLKCSNCQIWNDFGGLILESSNSYNLLEISLFRIFEIRLIYCFLQKRLEFKRKSYTVFSIDRVRLNWWTDKRHINYGDQNSLLSMAIQRIRK